MEPIENKAPVEGANDDKELIGAFEENKKTIQDTGFNPKTSTAEAKMPNHVAGADSEGDIGPELNEAAEADDATDATTERVKKEKGKDSLENYGRNPKGPGIAPIL